MMSAHSARLAGQGDGPATPAPIRVRIEAIGVDAPVQAVGIDPRGGGVRIPVNVGWLGWYRFGPSPGHPGSAVIVGHVDSAAQGPGAFLRLRDLVPGDVVLVGFTHGTRSFVVVARRMYPKIGLPNDVFATSGKPVLALVTCGGAFDRVTRHYSDNVVVYAVPSKRAGGG
jgi:hypothetical protein